MTIDHSHDSRTEPTRVDASGIYESSARAAAASRLAGQVARAGVHADITGDDEASLTANHIVGALKDRRVGSLYDAATFAALYGQSGQDQPVQHVNPSASTELIDTQPATEVIGRRVRASEPQASPSSSKDFGARDRFVSPERRMPGWYDRNGGRNSRT